MVGETMIPSRMIWPVVIITGLALILGGAMVLTNHSPTEGVTIIGMVVGGSLVHGSYSWANAAAGTQTMQAMDAVHQGVLTGAQAALGQVQTSTVSGQQSSSTATVTSTSGTPTGQAAN